jgi:hypothetical protein
MTRFPRNRPASKIKTVPGVMDARIRGGYKHFDGWEKDVSEQAKRRTQEAIFNGTTTRTGQYGTHVLLDLVRRLFWLDVLSGVIPRALSSFLLTQKREIRVSATWRKSVVGLGRPWSYFLLTFENRHWARFPPFHSLSQHPASFIVHHVVKHFCHPAFLKESQLTAVILVKRSLR